MSEEQPTIVETLYLDAEHFVLTVESQPPLEPRERVVPVGRPFPGLLPSLDPARPASSKEKLLVEDGDAYKDLLTAAMYGHSSSEATQLIDAFAHELAEKIRSEQYIHGCCSECHSAADACADLIDPGPVRPGEEPTT
jgi:hypothetical protein